jgi:rod shape-determining protein MreD
MNNVIAKNSMRFIVVFLAQVLLFNAINFLGYVNPYIYIIFILLFPIKNNRLVFLITAFLLGIFMDIFMDFSGVHAAAAVSLAYIRPVLLKFSFGAFYEYQTLKISDMGIGNLIAYISTATIFHHFILFSLEIFNISQAALLLKKVLFSSLFTILLSLLFILLFKTRK